MEKFNRIDREIVYKGAILEFCKDEIITPKGNKVKWDYLQHKGAAAVIPVMNDGRILMVRQWRNAIDRFALEIPAGGKDSVDEPSERCAARELEEETGYKSDKLEFLQTIDVYVAFEFKKGKQHFDPDEDIELELFSVEELIKMIMNNEINDSKTTSAILTYYHKYCLE